MRACVRACACACTIKSIQAGGWRRKKKHPGNNCWSESEHKVRGPRSGLRAAPTTTWPTRASAASKLASKTHFVDVVFVLDDLQSSSAPSKSKLYSDNAFVRAPEWKERGSKFFAPLHISKCETTGCPESRHPPRWVDQTEKNNFDKINLGTQWLM